MNEIIKSVLEANPHLGFHALKSLVYKQLKAQGFDLSINQVQAAIKQYNEGLNSGENETNPLNTHFAFSTLFN